MPLLLLLLLVVHPAYNLTLLLQQLKPCATPNLNFLLPPLFLYSFCHAWLPLLPLLVFNVFCNLIVYSSCHIWLPPFFSFLLLLLMFCAILNLMFRLSLLLLVHPCCHAWLPSPPLCLLMLLKPCISICSNKAFPKYIRWLNLPLFPCFLSHFTGSLFNLRGKNIFIRDKKSILRYFNNFKTYRSATGITVI